MKIGIDARMLGKGFGLARYVEQLIGGLLDSDSENEYVIFLREESFVQKTTDHRPQTTNNVKYVLVDIDWYSFEEQIKFTNIIKKEKVDLMHFPHWNVPLFYNDPFVVTIHDLIMYHYPRPEATTLGPIKFWLKDKMHRVIVNHAVKKAQHVLVTSDFTKYDVHETLGVNLDKMTVVYQAPFERITKTKVLDKYNIKEPYVLYVGAAYPHKNLERLLQAWKIFCEDHDNGYQLIFVGKEDYFYKKLVTSYKLLVTNFKYLGFVSDLELEELYDNAKLFVFPSLYEGFGLPPLEAMSHGVPVVASSSTCLPEVLGEGSLYFDPENVEQMAGTIYIGLTNEDIRSTLRQNAKHELLRYSSSRFIALILERYQKFARQ
ncbi:MAG: hypothetical protein COX81_01330 [Candidatus Magasanikbacteria bacterium CG_4_10_14_0_2_um_filter_37_12]|uniref:Glycosyltransferase family 1 protein n=1 Tax=Candidatus Magasanikbacteria bacterium CG_4_10_14_0_2_um_filter_37_12 TaxID=1974637 RepID=A0A2M7V8R8_9BACT|nr:MAG: hypothetical protein COX81_01330 [Candidatus Magasanikbacteria bacterium CG_4_10_14_0_2_um_filter_37_12]